MFFKKEIVIYYCSTHHLIRIYIHKLWISIYINIHILSIYIHILNYIYKRMMCIDVILIIEAFKMVTYAFLKIV